MNSQTDMEYELSDLLSQIGDITDRRRLMDGLWDKVCLVTNYLKESAGLSQRVWHIKNGSSLPGCQKCGNAVKWHQQTKKYRPYCSSSCSRDDPKRIEKSRQGLMKTIAETDLIERRAKTNLEKYGSRSFLGTSEARAALHKWSEDNLGVSHPSKSDKIKKQKRRTSLERFGTEHAAQSSEIKQKTKDYFTQTYGSHPMKLDSVKEKQANVFVEKYGKHFKSLHVTDETSKILSNKETLSSMNETMTLCEIAKALDVSPSMVGKAFKRLQLKYINHGRSAIEREVEQFIKSLGFLPEISNRTLIQPLELDLIIPEKSLAVEVNGSYWHAEGRGIDSNYHLTKTLRCLDAGYKLFHIQDYLWNSKKDIVKSRLMYALGCSEVISARKCEIKRISSKIADNFMNENHIQGSCRHSHALALYMGDILVACMTFGKPRFSKKYDWELLRYSTMKKNTVVGGSSRLLKYFGKNNKGTIVTYADRNYGEGNVYIKMGFEFSHATKPSYAYTKDYKKFYNRMAFQKHKLENILEDFDPTQTEWENMSRHDWDRVWDCGTNVFTITFED